MDYKGHFALRHGRCHPLTVLGSRSRFAVGLSACANEREVTARQRLSAVFATLGLPLRILADNGPPFGTASTKKAYSSLEVWLMRLGIAVFHGRPRHPQTQGPSERFQFAACAWSCCGDPQSRRSAARVRQLARSL